MTPHQPDDAELHSGDPIDTHLNESSEIASGRKDAQEGSSPESKPPHPHFGWAVLWMLAFWAVQIAISVVVVIIAVIIAALQGRTSPEELEQAMMATTVVMIPIGTLFSVFTAMVVAFVFYRRQFGRRLALRGITWQQGVASLLIILPMAVIASEITNCAGEVLPSFSAEVLGEFANGSWLLIFISACLFPAIGEEIFCRGFLGRGLVANHGVVFGVFLASLLFGIMHIDPVQSIGAFVLGLGLHFIYLTTRSLLAPMLVHMLNNAFAFWTIQNYESFPLPGLTPLSDGTLVHTPPSVIIAATSATIALLALFYQTRTRWELVSVDSSEEEASYWTPGYQTAEQPPARVACRAVTSHPSRGLIAFVVLTYLALVIALYLSTRA